MSRKWFPTCHFVGENAATQQRLQGRLIGLRSYPYQGNYRPGKAQHGDTDDEPARDNPIPSRSRPVVTLSQDARQDD